MTIVIVSGFFGAVLLGFVGIVCWRLGEEFADWMRGRK